jgi:hypothetical protein
MDDDLTEYLATAEFEKFEPKPMYSVRGDFLTVFFREDDAYERRVDESLTLYFSESGNELVGCKIKGVSAILKTFADFDGRSGEW